MTSNISLFNTDILGLFHFWTQLSRWNCWLQ